MNERIFYLSGRESLEELESFLVQCRADTIFFVFPRKSWIFQQNTDLQALRDIAEKHNKELIIITKNAIAREKIQSIGISVFASLEDREKTPFEKMIHQKGYSFSPKKISNIPIETLQKALQKKSSSTPQSNNSFPTVARPVIHALILLGIFLLGFFIFLLHVAIPDAIVNITPFKKEEEMHINLHMLSHLHFSESDLWRENNGIFVYPIEKVYEVSKTFSHISQEFRGKNASGKMKIINTLPEEFTFKKGTRIQNNKGIIFLTKDWITIPASKNGENGEIIIDVVASERDKYQTFQGEKANMPKGQKFIFPGLEQHLQSKIFAENTSPMTGGKTKLVYKITKDNIERAKGELIEAVRKKKKEEFEYIIKNNFPKEKHMEMLPLSGKQFESEVLEIIFENDKNGEKNLIGQERTEFSGKIRVRIKNYAYSKDELLELIKEKFKRSAPEGMELLSIDKRVFNPEVLYVYDNKNRIKVNFSARGVYQYIIEPKSKKGLLFSQKIKTTIAGMKKEKAKKTLINNFKEISDVDIKLWPFWVKKLPTLPEKIQIKTKRQ